MNLKKLTETMEKDDYEQHHQKIKFYYSREERLKRKIVERTGVPPEVLERRRRRNTFVIFLVDILLIVLLIYLSGDKIAENLYESSTILHYDDYRFRMSTIPLVQSSQFKVHFYIANTSDTAIQLPDFMVNNTFFFLWYENTSVQFVNILLEQKEIPAGEQNTYQQKIEVSTAQSLKLIGIAFPEPDMEEEEIEQEIIAVQQILEGNTEGGANQDQLHGQSEQDWEDWIELLEDHHYQVVYQILDEE
jgi:hypothetical protein